MRLDQLLGACLQANPQFGFDLWHEIIDDFLQDQLRGISQLVVEMTLGERSEGRTHGRLAWLDLRLGCWCVFDDV